MSLRIKSAVWMLFAAINFAILNTLVKLLSENYSVSQIIFFRSFFAIIFILPLIINSGFSSLKTKSLKMRDKFEKYLKKFNIEFRRGNAGGGNQLRQPYLKKFLKSKISPQKFENVEHIHFFGYYIGNYPDLRFKKIDQIVKILNSFKFN